MNQKHPMLETILGTGTTAQTVIEDNTLALSLTTTQVHDLQDMIMGVVRINQQLLAMHSGRNCEVEIEAKEWLEKCAQLNQAVQVAVTKKMVDIRAAQIREAIAMIRKTAVSSRQ